MPDQNLTTLKHLPSGLFADLSEKLAERLGYVDGPFNATNAVSLVSELRHLHAVGAVSSLSLPRSFVDGLQHALGSGVRFKSTQADMLVAEVLIRFNDKSIVPGRGPGIASMMDADAGAERPLIDDPDGRAKIIGEFEWAERQGIEMTPEDCILYDMARVAEDVAVDEFFAERDEKLDKTPDPLDVALVAQGHSVQGQPSWLDRDAARQLVGEPTMWDADGTPLH